MPEIRLNTPTERALYRDCEHYTKRIAELEETIEAHAAQCDAGKQRIAELEAALSAALCSPRINEWLMWKGDTDTLGKMQGALGDYQPPVTRRSD